jgi:hypothetical protein
MVGHSDPCLSSELYQEVQIERPGPGQTWHKARPYLENNQHKKAGEVAPVIECLSSKYEALRSIPQYGKKKKRKWNVHDLGFGNGFLNIIPKAQETQENTS